MPLSLFYSIWELISDYSRSLIGLRTRRVLAFSWNTLAGSGIWTKENLKTTTDDYDENEHRKTRKTEQKEKQKTEKRKLYKFTEIYNYFPIIVSEWLSQN